MLRCPVRINFPRVGIGDRGGANEESLQKVKKMNRNAKPLSRLVSRLQNNGNLSLSSPISIFNDHPSPILLHSRHFSHSNPNNNKTQFLPQNSEPQSCQNGFKNVDDAITLFHQRLQSRPRPSIIAFNHILTSIIKMKHYSTAISLLKILDLLHILPNLCSLNMTIHCYCRLGYVDLGFSNLGKIIKLGYEPDIVTFDTLIHGLFANNKFADAQKLFCKVVDLDLQLNVVTYGIFINGLCRLGHIFDALKLLRDMEDTDGCKPSVVTYNTIISSLCKAGKIQHALALLHEMQSRGQTPNSSTLCILLDGLCKHHQLDKAINLFKTMLDDGVVPDIKAYTSLIDGMCKAGRLDDARLIFYSLSDRNIRPDVWLYSIMINALCKEGRLAEADEMLKEMEEVGCLPNHYTYNTLLRGALCKRDIRAARRYIGLMMLGGVSVDPYNLKVIAHVQANHVSHTSSGETLPKFLVDQVCALDPHRDSGK